MSPDNARRPEWRHLLPIPGVVEESVGDTRPLHVVVDVNPAVGDMQDVQHVAWLLVTLLTRSTPAVIASVGLIVPDIRLNAGVDPGAPDGGPSLSAALEYTASTFGPQAAPVVIARDVGPVDLVLQIGEPTRAWENTRVLHVAARGWAGAVSSDAVDVPQFSGTDNPFGSYIAACLAAGQAFMLARLRDPHLEPLALNAWTLAELANRREEDATHPRPDPVVHLDHVLAGVGAVGSALLLTLWAYPNASGIVRAADADEKGIDTTNLNRCVPFGWTDLGGQKADVVADRLSGRHGLTIEATNGRAERLVDSATHLISAVDTPEARQALQDRYPASAVQASTSGLRLETLRVNPTVGSACLRCFNPPRPITGDIEVRANVAAMDDDAIAAHAEALGTDSSRIREWGQVGGCGQLGDALLDRLRPSNGSAAQFSVGFMSVLAGILLAAQVIKDATRRTDRLHTSAQRIPLIGPEARFVMNLMASAHAPSGVRRYGRDPDCPACEGVRAEIWMGRWTG